jgi:hypothetical protein
MWPFKKEKKSVTKIAKSIICITGNWVDFEDFHQSLILSSGAAYMVVGDLLINGRDQRHYTFEFCEHDVRMRDSFAVAGKVNNVSEAFLDEIDKHSYVIYISGETGDFEEAAHIARAGNAILKAGGSGIKVESAGKAFTGARWTELMENFETHYLYEMFVLDSIIDNDGTVYSCGMQNLGLKDTIVSGEEVTDAMDLIRIFGYYQIVDLPVIENNQTFRKDAVSPVFKITDEQHPRNEGHETFENPFGMWRLTQLNQQASR